MPVSRLWRSYAVFAKLHGYDSEGDVATSTLSAAGKEAIDEMVRRIVERFDPEKIILFGSHARGAAGPDSDVDLLVVMRFEASRRGLTSAIDVALWDRKLPLDLIVVTPEELERDRDRVGTIVRPALREGRVLYERVA